MKSDYGFVLQRLEERKATMVIGKRKMVNSPPEMISLVSCCQLQMSEIISSKICDLYLIIKKKKKQKVIAKNLVFVSYFKKRAKNTEYSKMDLSTAFYGVDHAIMDTLTLQ